MRNETSINEKRKYSLNAHTTQQASGITTKHVVAKRSEPNQYLCLTILLSIMMATVPLVASASLFQVLSFGDNYTEIEFYLPDLEFEEVVVNGQAYQRISHQDAGFIAEPGLPELLSYSTVLAIPDRGEVYADKPIVHNMLTLNDMSIYPSQGLNLDINPETGFVKDRMFYEADKSWGMDLLQVSSPAIMRDIRLITITINPYVYNPASKELSVRNRVTVRINYDLDSIGDNERLGVRPKSKAFQRILRNSVLNYNQYESHFGNRNPYQTPHVLVIHHSSETYTGIINQFASWKRDKGFQVTTVSNAEMSGVIGVKQYIQEAYDTWENRPEYVLFIGNFQQIPISTATGTQGDHVYTLLEGEDILSDIIIGRLAVSSQFELATVWNKIKNYEIEPYMSETDWYNHNLIIGDRYASSLNMGKYVRDVMSNYSSNKTFAEHYSVGSSTNFTNQANNAINQGISFYMYRGYWGMSGWGPSANALDNGLKLFHGTFFTCQTLDNTTTNATVATVNLGTPTVAKGGITAIGMFTGGTNSAQNNCLTAGIYYGIFVENLHSMGEALVRAKLNLWNTYSNSYTVPMSQHIHWANLIGDPTMNIWKEIPKNLNVEYSEILMQGTNYIDFAVTDDNNQPLKDVWLTIRQEQSGLLLSSYTNQDGVVSYLLPANSGGTFAVTATKLDYKPHIGSFDVSEEEQAVAFFEVIAQDDFVAGTTSSFGISLKNYRSQQVNNINGTISTNSNYIEILEAMSLYGNISASGIAGSNSNYVINISPDTPEQYKAFFDLIINDNEDNSWQSRFAVTIQNGYLELETLVIDDGNNGILEPGEQAYLMFYLTNTGTHNLYGVNGSISISTNGFAIINNDTYFGDIAINATTTSISDDLQVLLAYYVIPGTFYDIELHLYNGAGYSQIIQHKIETGIVTVTDPLGPCDYGYRAYDIGDIDYVEAPEYDWIEIVPNLGGTGVNTGLESDYDNTQQTVTIDLPFTFSLYGEEYDIISICANGWVSFREMEEATQRNWRIPGPKVPMPVIAVFWDNLSIASDGGVYTWYDQDNSLFVIQWHNAKNVVGNAVEEFQLILYDPAVYLTLTDDGPFKMQYRVFNNINNSTGSPDGEWGNYASVGIADHTGKRGLEYTFNNRYPTAARALGNESALYWTTGLSTFFIAIEEFSFTDDNNNIPEFGEQGFINMRLRNIGIEDGVGITTTLTTTDPYITILQNEAYFGNISAGESVIVENAYSLSIADSVPDNHNAVFELTIEAPEQEYSNSIEFSLLIFAPNLTNLNPVVDDSQGNNNGLIEAGEQVNIYIPLKNIGKAASPPVTITIESNSDIFEIVNIPETDLMSIIPDETLYPSVKISVNDNAEAGDLIVLNYTLETGSYVFTDQIIIGVAGLLPVQIGEGTNTNLPTAASPINIQFKSLRSQTVYTTTELWSAGIPVGVDKQLSSLAYFVDSPPAYPLINFTIRMKHTSAVNVRNHDAGAFVTVFETESYMPVAGEWNHIEFNTPFDWNGNDNILIDTAFAPVEQWNSSGQVRVFQRENGFRFVRGDTPDQTNAETTHISSDKPQVKIVMKDDPHIASLRPQNLVYEIDDLSVLLRWQPPFENIRTESRNRNNILRHGSNSRNPDGYNVYRNGAKLNDDLIEDTEYIDDTLDQRITNYYYITAVYEDRETLPSNIITVSFDSISAPVFNPSAGIYSEPITISIQSEPQNATIHYTLNGEEPTEEDPVYTEPLEVEWSTQIKAKAFLEVLLPSRTASAEYIILYPPQNMTADAEINSAALTWTEPRSMDNLLNYQQHSQQRLRHRNNRSSQLSRQIFGYNLYRSVNNSEFSLLAHIDYGINDFLDDQLNSGVYQYFVTALYNEGESASSDKVTAHVGIVAPPLFFPEPGLYSTPVEVTIASDTRNAAIHYTLDDSRPTESSSQYNGEPIVINQTTILKAIAFLQGWQRSLITTGIFTIDYTSVEDHHNTPPLTTKLYDAYPNPFNPQTTISFDLQQSGQASLNIYNIRGQKVIELVNQHLLAGSHTYIWEGVDSSIRPLSNGIYFYRLTAADYTEVKKILLLK